jgi:hypothetical protein
MGCKLRIVSSSIEQDKAWKKSRETHVTQNRHRTAPLRRQNREQLALTRKRKVGDPIPPRTAIQWDQVKNKDPSDENSSARATEI